MKPIRVAIVDDDEAVRVALAKLIEGEGLELAGTAANAEEGIELAGRERPDVALVDVKMEGGGPHATEAMLARSSGTRVVALSAYADRGAVLEMLRAGAIGYLVKGCSADELITTVKRAARGKGTLSSEITAEVVNELASHLHRAERDASARRQRAERIHQVLEEGLLRMVFQPIVGIVNRKTIGFEALSRFPEHFGLPPNVWFADAAEVGLGEELELAAAALALQSLEEHRGDVFVSINLSPETASGSRCRELLEGVDRSRVVLEMTEHAPVEDYEILEGALAQLRERRVRIAVDDMGAGFASLRHILHVAPEFVKLDVSLTRGISKDPSRRALAAALTAFADELGIEIIAEGVERPEELTALSELEVHYAQGYLLGRPAPLGVHASR